MAVPNLKMVVHLLLPVSVDDKKVAQTG